MDIHDHPIPSSTSQFIRSTIRKFRRLSKGGSPRQRIIILVGWAACLYVVLRTTSYLYSLTPLGSTNYLTCDSSRYQLSRSVSVPKPADSRVVSQTWKFLQDNFDAYPPRPLTLTQKPFENSKDFPSIEVIKNHTIISQEDVEASRASHIEIVKSIPPYPRNVFSGRGIVMLAGGRYSSFATTGLGMLREIGSKLPIEVWVKDQTEEKEGWCDEIKKEGMACRRISDYMDVSSNKHGYQLKISSILFSSFEEILFLDADNVPVRNPDGIFEAKSYTDTGVVLWQDYWKHSGSPWLPYVVGISGDASEALRHDDTVESGQLVWNKKRHWKALCLATYYNYYGPQHYYTLISQGWAGWGDKDTFPVALQALHEDFYLVPHKLKTMFVDFDDGSFRGIGMLQADPTNQTGYEPMFLHSNVIKWGIRDFLCVKCTSGPGEKAELSALENQDSSINAHLKEHRRIFKTEDIKELGIDPEPLMWKSMEHTACRSVWKEDDLCTRTREHMTKTFGYKFHTGRIASILGFRESVCVMDP